LENGGGEDSLEGGEVKKFGEKVSFGLVGWFDGKIVARIFVGRRREGGGFAGGGGG
jgi:hypothetical protein